MRVIQAVALALLCSMPTLAWAEEGIDPDAVLTAVPAAANEDQGVEPWLPLQDQDGAVAGFKAPISATGKDEHMGCHRQQRAQTVFYTQ